MRGRRPVPAARRYGYALLAMARPGFLLGSVPLYLVGVAASLDAGYPLGVPEALSGLLLVATVQLATHYNNEYRDVAVDSAREAPARITGGSRVLANGLVPPGAARIAAIVCLIAAVVVAAATAIAFDAGAAFVALVGAAILGGWFYSSPPIALAARGLGEVTVALVTGFLVPAVAYLLQASALDEALLRASLPLVPLAFAVSLATAVPDVEADRAGGKMTLAARLGSERALLLDAAALLAGGLLFGRLAVSLHPLLGPAALAVLLAPLVAYARYAPAAARGSTDAAERVGLIAIATLGWASTATVALLLL